MCDAITLCAKLAAGAGLGRPIRTSDIFQTYLRTSDIRCAKITL